MENAAGTVIGGAGVDQLAHGPDEVCELKKMYFLPEARGHGLGATMLQHCLEAARQRGYTTCYLETLERMSAAQHLYRKFGFTEIDGPMGNTGHCSCDRFYTLAL